VYNGGCSIRVVYIVPISVNLHFASITAYDCELNHPPLLCVMFIISVVYIIGLKQILFFVHNY